MNEISEIVVQLPKQLGLGEFEIKMIVAVKLFEIGKLTSGEAAEMVGLSKRAFIEMLGKYEVSVFGYDLSDEDLSLV